MHNGQPIAAAASVGVEEQGRRVLEALPQPPPVVCQELIDG